MWSLGKVSRFRRLRLGGFRADAAGARMQCRGGVDINYSQKSVAIGKGPAYGGVCVGCGEAPMSRMSIVDRRQSYGLSLRRGLPSGGRWDELPGGGRYERGE